MFKDRRVLGFRREDQPASGNPDSRLEQLRRDLEKDRSALAAERSRLQKERSDFEEDLGVLEEQRHFLDRQREQIRHEAMALDAKRDELSRTQTMRAARTGVDSAIEDARRSSDAQRMQLRTEMSDVLRPGAAKESSSG